MFKKIKSMINDLIEIVKLTEVDHENKTATVETVDGLVKGAVFAQQYGFSSYPPMYSDALVFNVAGDISNSLVFATVGERYDSLSDGDVRIYDVHDNEIKMTAKGITIISKSKITINADIVVNGSITATDDVTAGLSKISLINHTHPVVGSATLPPNKL